MIVWYLPPGGAPDGWPWHAGDELDAYIWRLRKTDPGFDQAWTAAPWWRRAWARIAGRVRPPQP